jgi:hypothetical protein
VSPPLKLALKGILLLPGAALLIVFLFLYVKLLVTTRPLSALQLFVYLGIPVLQAAAAVGVFVSAKLNGNHLGCQRRKHCSRSESCLWDLGPVRLPLIWSIFNFVASGLLELDGAVLVIIAFLPPAPALVFA